MKSPIETLAVVATNSLLTTNTWSQSGAWLVVPVENEPSSKSFVEASLPAPPAGGVAFIPRVRISQTVPFIAEATKLVHHSWEGVRHEA